MNANDRAEIFKSDILTLAAGDVLAYTVNGSGGDSYTVPAGKTAKLVLVIDGGEAAV